MSRMIIFETIICAETEIALNLSCTITTTNIRKPLVIEGVFYVQVLFHDQALDLVGEPLQDGDQLPKFKRAILLMMFLFFIFKLR